MLNQANSLENMDQSSEANWIPYFPRQMQCINLSGRNSKSRYFIQELQVMNNPKLCSNNSSRVLTGPDGKQVVARHQPSGESVVYGAGLITLVIQECLVRLCVALSKAKGSDGSSSSSSPFHPDLWDRATWLLNPVSLICCRIFPQIC